MADHTRLLGIAGWRNSGKTQLVRGLIPVLRDRGVRVATIKHAHHAFDVDQPGKDSYEHRQAGAREVLISSAKRWALMHEHAADEPEPTLRDLLPKLSPVDLVLVEGFKRETHPKLEVHRPSLGKPLLSVEDDSVVAIASDAHVPNARVPVVDLNDVEQVAATVIARAQPWPDGSEA